MRLYPGRVLGIFLGLVILFTILEVPFGTADTSSFYGRVTSWILNLSTIQSSYTAADQIYAYIFIVAFVLLIIAGFVGVFPLGTGVLGVVGMTMVTVAPFVAYPADLTKLDAGVGFYTIWVASIASLGASFWHGKPPAATQTSASAQNAESADIKTMNQKCPNCGTMNASDAVQCSNCGTQLMKEP